MFWAGISYTIFRTAILLHLYILFEEESHAAEKRKDEIPHAHTSADAAEYYMSQVKNFDKSRKYSDEEIAYYRITKNPRY